MSPRRDLALADPSAPQRIRPSRFVAGIALHFAVPAYLIWLAIALIPSLGSGDRDQLAATAGQASLQFLLFYAVFLVAITLATRALEPALRQARERREARNPLAAGRQSKAQLSSALRTAATIGNGKALHEAIERLRSAPWRHEDQRFQTIASDLARAANAFAVALDGAPPTEREELEALAARSFGRIAEAVEQLAEEQRRLDHGDARTLAHYIELRYPSSDFASEQNS
jgi:membrane protein implicated in regulation of membrane protease activity